MHCIPRWTAIQDSDSTYSAFGNPLPQLEDTIQLTYDVASLERK